MGPPARQTCTGGLQAVPDTTLLWRNLDFIDAMHQKAEKLIQKGKHLMTAPATKGIHTLHIHILQVKVFVFDISPTQTWMSRWIFSSFASSAAREPSTRAKASLRLTGISARVMQPWKWNLMCNYLDDEEDAKYTHG